MKKKHKNNNKKSDSSYWLYGRHSCVAAMSNEKRVVRRVIATKNIAVELENEPYEIELKDSFYISSILPEGAVHQGIACLVEPIADMRLKDIYDEKIVVILDQVTDPHNIGAIIRSSAAFGAGAVILPKNNAPDETATMAKSASGALELMPMVKIGNLASAIDELKESGFWVIGLDGYADKNLHELDRFDKVALVCGAEGKGMRKLTKEKCDLTAKLPMSDKVESLNVSNAAAVALYELCSKS